MARQRDCRAHCRASSQAERVNCRICQSACGTRHRVARGQTNSRVVRHLVRGTLLRLCKPHAERGRRTPARPDGQPMTVEDVRAQFRSRNDVLALDMLNALTERLTRSGEELLEAYWCLEPHDTDRPAWHPSGVLTIGTFLAYRVGELGLHGWDIRPRSIQRPDCIQSCDHLLPTLSNSSCRTPFPIDSLPRNQLRLLRSTVP